MRHVSLRPHPRQSTRFQRRWQVLTRYLTPAGRGAYAIRALRDLRLGIKSEGLERVMHDTPFGSSLESPGPPGAFL